MTAHGAKQAIGSTRHVTVVTPAAFGIRGVMRVHCDLRRHGLVTLQTGSIAIHVWFQLRVMRPALQARLVRRIEMHFVTGDAREFAAAETR